MYAHACMCMLVCFCFSVCVCVYVWANKHTCTRSVCTFAFEFVVVFNDMGFSFEAYAVDKSENIKDGKSSHQIQEEQSHNHSLVGWPGTAVVAAQGRRVQVFLCCVPLAKLARVLASRKCVLWKSQLIGHSAVYKHAKYCACTVCVSEIDIVVTDSCAVCRDIELPPLQKKKI